VRLTEQDIAIEGAFELPGLPSSPPRTRCRSAAFVRSHGSDQEMEQVFGVSYPTVKARLQPHRGQHSSSSNGSHPRPREVLSACSAARSPPTRPLQKLEGRP